MYEVNLRILLAGLPGEAVTAIQQVPSKERFTHHYTVVQALGGTALEDGAFDVVIFTEAAMGELSLDEVCRMAGDKAHRILVTEHPQALQPAELEALDALWPAPLTATLAQYAFTRLTEQLKARKDAWMEHNYWQTTINSSPDLIWYKDKIGAHLEVNDAFCEVVGKDKDDIRGRGHYYIWGLTKEEYEKGEFVCNETEEAVMNAGKAMVFDEHVLSKNNGMRELRTYKSPLFDEDGTILGTVGVAMDVTTENEYRKKVLAMAQHDRLTGLPNRRYFYEYVKEHENEKNCLISLDIDNFKQFNDSFGHKIGDEVLVLFAATLHEAFSHGFVTRFGGDEFLVLYVGKHDAETIRQAVRTFHDTLRERSQNMKSGIISATVGLAFDPTGSLPIDKLYQRSDQALYYAKGRSKGTDAEWNEDMNR